MSARILVRCVRGLEWLVAQEVTARLGPATDLAVGSREVTFRLPAPTSELTRLTTADDVFVEIGAVGGVGRGRSAVPDLAGRLTGLDWRGVLAGVRAVRPVPDRPRFDVVASLDGDRTFNRYEVENALGPLLVPVLQGSFLARTSGGRAPGEIDLTVRVFVRGSGAVAALRLAARPLHRRPYKLDTGPGTLHPPVAAALARLAAPEPGELVLDPFCGDGTVVIETALAYPDSRVTGSDIDPDRLANACRNAQRAGVVVEFGQADAGALRVPAGSVAVLVTNPPWGVAVAASGLLARSADRFWRSLPELMTRTGRIAMISDQGLDLPDHLARRGYLVGRAETVRLQGRLSHVILCAPPA